MKSTILTFPLLYFDPLTQKSQQLFCSYPDAEFGFDLYSCLHCGELYALNRTKQLYTPLDFKTLHHLSCLCCHKQWGDFIKPYPDSFLFQGSEIRHFEKPTQYPDDRPSQPFDIYDLHAIIASKARES